MRLCAATIVTSLTWTACSVAGPAPTEAGQTFSLRAGQSALSRDGALRVGFEGVTADSRCPRGEQCVRAGDATARVWLQKGSGPRLTFELRTVPGPAQAVRSLDHELRLLRLDPDPVAGQPLAKGGHVVTLALHRHLESEPER